MPEYKKIPKGSLSFIDKGCSSFIEFAKKEDGEEKKDDPKLNMTLYSGGIIKDHWYWDDLALDLNGLKLTKSKYPVLEDHQTSKKIGFSGKPLVKDGKLVLDPETVTFVDTEVAQEFLKVAGAGFPFQSSLRGTPFRVERISEGSEAEVNGFKLKGPASVWREWEYMEGSVCVFGWDDKTEASVFSKEEIEIDFVEEINGSKKEVLKTMDIETFKKEHPDLFKKIQEEAVNVEKEEFSKKEKDFSEKIIDLTAQLSESSNKIKELEKKDAIRAEREMKFKADSVWTEKLTKSSIPERLFSKVRTNVSYSQFVKEGSFDETEFGKAVDAEIKEWEELNISEPVVKGSGFAAKEEEKNSLTKENDEIVDSLCSFVGIKSETK